MPKKVVQGLGVGTGAVLLTLLLKAFGVLDAPENGLWASRVRLWGHAAPSTSAIKIILLDQASLDWAAKENSLPWPWPRSVYGPIIDFCKQGGARVVAFDVLFTESSDLELMSEDVQLGEAVARAGNFVGAVYLGAQAKQTDHWPVTVAKPVVSVDGLDAWMKEHGDAVRETGAAFPVPDVATNAMALGNVKDEPDRDGVFRRAGLFRVFDGVALPSLGLAAYLVGRSPALHIEPGHFHADHVDVPIDDRGRALLRFRGRPGVHETFSAAAIIKSQLQLQEGAKPQIDPAVFKDTYVFFGFSAPGLKDLRPVPQSGDYPGVLIHATLLDNLLERDAMRDAAWLPVWAGAWLLAVLAALFVVHSRTTWQNVLGFFLFLPIPFVAGYAAYQGGWWWPIMSGVGSTGFALVGGVVLNYATEGRQKRFIKSAFNQYVGEEVLDELVRDPSKLKLGGEKRELTMFFSDLEKFSSFSERLAPPQLIELLNVYLTEMGQIIKQEAGGYVDKFVGDAIVAFWNAPVLQADHAARAVRAAVLCQRRLAEKREEWAAQFGAVLKMRIGIGTGTVVIGNMGSLDKFNYTMLGDEANAASRLEGANKAFGTYTMLSEATWSQARTAAIGREIGAIRVVGRKTPVKVYEPLGLAGDTLPAWVADFERGVVLCREQRWQEALAIFEKIPNDHVAEVYAQRCRDLIAGAIPGWDGVWNLTEK